jgi:ABC-type Mn2+/Zn2+ transport system ATPase subunit/GNAT superfamily N-acetyltransferase
VPSIDLVKETPVSRSPRARQLEAMFDVPASTIATQRWIGEVPLEERAWQVGLIVGPSGSGKSSILAHLFDVPPPLQWTGASVLDDFDKALPIADITGVCQAVGFNTVPAWLRPFNVLSNGEQFRVALARRLVTPGLAVVDEFTSVVDRQVAQIASHAVQKFIRKTPGRKFVAASCHEDIVPWLQPDWILEPATMRFTWRSLQRSRPPLDCLVARVPYDTWRIFAPFHYLTADLHRAARCYALFVGSRIAAFAAMLFRPHATVNDIMGCSRLVTLPDFQGLGLSMALIDKVAAAYGAVGKRVHTYPAHPSLIRTFDRSPVWSLSARPGRFSNTNNAKGKRTTKLLGHFGGRPNAVFEYVGPFSDKREAERLIAG